MPLIMVNTIEDYRPDRTTPEARATKALARRLPSATAIAVNKVDGRMGDRMIDEDMVRVDFGVTDPYTINGSPMQIIISPSNNGLVPSSPEAQVRRCAIRDLIEEQIQAHMRVLAEDLMWPEYDIEMDPRDLSGLSSGSNGVMRTWGDPPAKVEARVRTTDVGDSFAGAES